MPELDVGGTAHVTISRYYVLVTNVFDNGCIVRTPFGVFWCKPEEILAVNPIPYEKLDWAIRQAWESPMDGVSRFESWRRY